MSLALDPTRGLGPELRRRAIDQAGRVKKAAHAIPTDPARGPHAARKEIKKLRALIRLLSRFDEPRASAENERWRLVATSLAGLREAAALVETVDRFLPRIGERDKLRPELLALRGRLEARLAEMAADERFLRALEENCVEAATAGAEALGEISFEGDDARAAELLADGARANWKEARAAMRRAGRRGREDDFHDLRKAVKRHAADREFLRRLWPGEKRRRRRADRLGDVLGELNDVFVIAPLQDELASSRAFSKLLARMRRKLAASALKLARKIFDRRPPKLAGLFAKELANHRPSIPQPAEMTPRAA